MLSSQGRGRGERQLLGEPLMCKKDQGTLGKIVGDLRARDRVWLRGRLPASLGLKVHFPWWIRLLGQRSPTAEFSVMEDLFVGR